MKSKEEILKANEILREQRAYENSAEIRPEDIPQGLATEDIKGRVQIIRQFYRQWKEMHPEQKMYNRSLRQDINIRMISIDETSSKASRDYRSTLAVLQLDAILTGAVKVASSKVKQGTANQNKFREMLIMHHLHRAGRMKEVRPSGDRTLDLPRENVEEQGASQAGTSALLEMHNFNHGVTSRQQM